MSEKRNNVIVPVIHYADEGQAMRNAERAFAAGCDGVLLIDMAMGHSQPLLRAACAIKARWAEKLVGVNLLGVDPQVAVKMSDTLGLDMTWIDEQLTHSGGAPWMEARRVAKARARGDHLIFVGTAFKYQPHEPDAATAALKASEFGFIPTTSGPATGRPADLSTIKDLWEVMGPESRLAVASGVTPENIAAFAPFVSHVLVSTGVSSSFHEFDPKGLQELVTACMPESTPA